MLEMKMRIQDKELENVNGTCGNTEKEVFCKKCGKYYRKSELLKREMLYITDRVEDFSRTEISFHCPRCDEEIDIYIE